jgi:hypothetical protein
VAVRQLEILSGEYRKARMSAYKQPYLRADDWLRPEPSLFPVLARLLLSKIPPALFFVLATMSCVRQTRIVRHAYCEIGVMLLGTAPLAINSRRHSR